MGTAVAITTVGSGAEGMDGLEIPPPHLPCIVSSKEGKPNSWHKITHH